MVHIQGLVGLHYSSCNVDLLPTSAFQEQEGERKRDFPLKKEEDYDENDAFYSAFLHILFTERNTHFRMISFAPFLFFFSSAAAFFMASLLRLEKDEYFFGHTTPCM